MSREIYPVSMQTASSEVKPFLEQIQKNFGFVPNLLATLANNPETLKSYLALSASFASAGLSPLEQQVVLLTVSRENNCGYCVAAHSAISAMSHLDERVITSIRKGEALEDLKLEALRTFTKRLVSSKGWIDESDLKTFLSSGYTVNQALAVILGLTLKTLSNYANHLASTELDKEFSAFSWNRN